MAHASICPFKLAADFADMSDGEAFRAADCEYARRRLRWPAAPTGERGGPPPQARVGADEL